MLLSKLMHYYSQYIRPNCNRYLDHLLPPLCLFCSKASAAKYSICAPCYNDLPILSHHCDKCAQILPITSQSSAPLICGQCLKQPPLFERTHALFAYQPPIIRLITALKFEQQLSHANLIAELLLEKIQQQWYYQQVLPDYILPVPLHRSRLSERGFNQALEIAKPIAKKLQLPLDLKGVMRTKATLAQSGLSAKERQNNLANAFQATKDYNGKFIAILDDVITTGHTISALTNTLKQAGAKQIHIWCAAKTQNHR